MNRGLGASIARLTLLLTSVSAFAAVTMTCAQAQQFKVVHNFTGGSDGGNPVDGFAISSTGILYGTASAGGDHGYGVVLKVANNGSETVLHSFAGGADGATPNGRAIIGPTGALFGTTTAGGASGLGTIYRIDGKKETVLYSFAGGSDGADPQAELTMDTAGNLYGTTAQGGPAGNGTVFELVAPAKKGGSWKEIVLYSFGTGTDGATPLSRRHDEARRI